MGEILEVQDVEQLRAERDDARRWAVRLEGELARAKERERSQEILRERAEADRETALGRLASCGYEVSAFRHQRNQARAERDEVVAALADLLAAVDELAEPHPDHGLMATLLGVQSMSAPAATARALVDRYRPSPATATIESHDG